jgi:hypothetical protein
MSRPEDIKAPPPGPIQPIFNDSLSQIERERRMLRYRAQGLTSPEATENVKGAAAAFGAQYGKIPSAALKRAPQPKGRQLGLSPTKSAATTAPTHPGSQFLKPKPQPKPQPTMSKNLIVPVNAQGAPVADTRPEAARPKLSFSPAPDGTFCKIADRPRPANHPLHMPWTQKYLATHDSRPFAIAMDESVANLLSNALNTYFQAVMQHQAEQEARKAAEAAAANDADAFGAPLVEETDAITGQPISAVGEPSEIEQLPSL